MKFGTLLWTCDLLFHAKFHFDTYCCPCWMKHGDFDKTLKFRHFFYSTLNRTWPNLISIYRNHSGVKYCWNVAILTKFWTLYSSGTYLPSWHGQIWCARVWHLLTLVLTVSETMHPRCYLTVEHQQESAQCQSIDTIHIQNCSCTFWLWLSGAHWWCGYYSHFGLITDEYLSCCLAVVSKHWREPCMLLCTGCSDKKWPSPNFLPLWYQ